ncbi:GAF domain-containing sensor histidine kinase [Streptantibioticus rubrisoli]|uniref:GAF domain-containing protein n=1 Tax=Streptantibioticus rubrisoli TaxID=1387313 RepID=A0ABT1P9N1_9ACTN|nr:GAF domain-containing protein [Streptantibioticus rubrisoli]MCQ4042084.1 GAF domain-containing protein [Streptantibioticus rubrisoli]
MADRADDLAELSELGELGRLPQLLSAVVPVGSGRDLRETLRRIVATGAELVGARCAALGVADPGGDGLRDVVTHGIDQIDQNVADRVGALPDGDQGLLDALLHDPASRPVLGVPVRVDGEVLGDLYLTGKRDGGQFSEADLHTARILAAQAGVAIGNARLYEATRQRDRWIEGVHAVTTALVSGSDPDEALQVVAEQARRLADSVAGVVLLPTQERGMEIVAASTEEPLPLLGTVVAPTSPVVSQLLAGEPVFVDDSATDPRMTTDVSRFFGPSMMLPLSSGGQVIGTLAVPRRRGDRPFSDTERRLAEQFAHQAAVVLVLADAQRDRERLAVFEDRDRIARDLHDLVVQRLFATGMLLESAQHRAEVPEVRERIGDAADELDATIQEVRTAIFALQQGPADAPAGLRTRVLRELGQASVPLGFAPSVRFTGAVDALVSDTTAKNLIAALRETLSNAFRHARASRIDIHVDATVTLPSGRSGVRLTVVDDGIGIPEGGRRSGLRNLSRRAEALGGSSSYGEGPDGVGAQVVWEAPL